MIYAIGDIHGQREMLEHALDLIARDGGTNAPVVFLGDFTDRGPDSRGVLEILTRGKAEGRPWHFVLGNHDRMFLRYVTEGVEHDPRVKSGISWLNPRLGGNTTLASYGLTGDLRFRTPLLGRETLRDLTREGARLSPEETLAEARKHVPTTHLAFLSELPLWHRHEDLLFVHAGLRPGIPLDDQDPEDLLWIRDDWLHDTRDHGPLVIHGHTPAEVPQHCGNRVNLDAGAGYGRPLIPAVFEGRDCWLLTEHGRMRLVP